MPRGVARSLLVSTSLLLGALPVTGAWAAAPAVAAGSPLAAPAAADASAAADPAVKLGPLTREEVEQAYPDWVAAEAAADVDCAAAGELMMAPAGAQVTVYFGTWCSDSRRELARFWRALDEVGDEVPFTVAYVGVDRKKVEPAALLAGLDVHHVPAFVVVRDGKEVGRVVEQAPHGIERDLADLLAGHAAGFLSATQRPDGSPPPARPLAGG